MQAQPAKVFKVIPAKLCPKIAALTVHGAKLAHVGLEEGVGVGMSTKSHFLTNQVAFIFMDHQ